MKKGMKEMLVFELEMMLSKLTRIKAITIFCLIPSKSTNAVLLSALISNILPGIARHILLWIKEEFSSV